MFLKIKGRTKIFLTRSQPIFFTVFLSVGQTMSLLFFIFITTILYFGFHSTPQEIQPLMGHSLQSKTNNETFSYIFIVRMEQFGVVNPNLRAKSFVN